jgi:hypothetical protein
MAKKGRYGCGDGGGERDGKAKRVLTCVQPLLYGPLCITY